MIQPKIFFPAITEASRERLAARTKDFRVVMVLSTKPLTFKKKLWTKTGEVEFARN